MVARGFASFSLCVPDAPQRQTFACGGSLLAGGFACSHLLSQACGFACSLILYQAGVSVRGLYVEVQFLRVSSPWPLFPYEAHLW